jgi:hypothetical protein
MTPAHTIVHRGADAGDEDGEQKRHQEAGRGMHAGDHDDQRGGGHQIGVRDLPALRPTYRRWLDVRDSLVVDLGRVALVGSKARCQVSCPLPTGVAGSPRVIAYHDTLAPKLVMIS